MLRLRFLPVAGALAIALLLPGVAGAGTRTRIEVINHRASPVDVSITGTNNASCAGAPLRVRARDSREISCERLSDLRPPFVAIGLRVSDGAAKPVCSIEFYQLTPSREFTSRTMAGNCAGGKRFSALTVTLP